MFFRTLWIFFIPDFRIIWKYLCILFNVYVLILIYNFLKKNTLPSLTIKSQDQMGRKLEFLAFFYVSTLQKDSNALKIHLQKRTFLDKKWHFQPPGAYHLGLSACTKHNKHKIKRKFVKDKLFGNPYTVAVKKNNLKRKVRNPFALFW